MLVRILFTALALAAVLYLQWAVDLPKWIESSTQERAESLIGQG